MSFPRTAASLEDLEWFHGDLSRHVTESVLLQNGRDGTYLLRTSNNNPGEYTLSVRCHDSVKHFRLLRGRDGKKYKFGMLTFENVGELLDHFAKKPMIGGDTGTLMVLKYPYSKNITEPACYDTVKVHAEGGDINFESNVCTNNTGQTMAISSKEGFLTKEGGIIKSWKTRWFVLCRNEFKYYKSREDSTPIRVLDLRECQGVDYDHYRIKDKENCFIVEFPDRTFYLFANTKTEADEWVRQLQWQVRHLQGKADPILLN
ncbi:dual adapter for phosphotyrosine and 3-phosphotyrosine and 3-phosphoinositide-like [Saccoglossus kowalevskii]|uniref:Dual adapter for phosphotyrosine and 3-phosphotyrosine and 3-phosphoinositide-like n=1 Tax=Saccoglossus kowalevskii TaxID=10224 RepID=A0ABM0GTW8_SACKO|nr:PREDICTED: dual adapter for phosphotyrosine and 3-phosphotyrosine and 3-phosphoinositide-like [Saccoglossus kowalevskii]